MAKSIFKEAQKYLENSYNAVFLDNEILAVLQPDAESPFLLIMYNPKQFDGFVLNFSLNFTQVHEAIDIVLNLQDIGPVIMDEPFVMNKKGEILFGDEAEFYNHPLKETKTINKEIH